MSKIEYRSIAGFDHYRVGDDGSIWSDFGGRWKLLRPTGGRYKHVMLCPGRVTLSVHTIVLETFVGPRPEGLDACHFPDRDTSNNRLENLRWDTKKSNQSDRSHHGTEVKGIKHYKTHLSDADIRRIRVRRTAGDTLAGIGKDYGITMDAVCKIATRRNWRHVSD